MSTIVYSLRIKKSAWRALLGLPYKERCRIDEKLRMLSENPDRRDLDVKKLSGFKLYRLRSGDYRVIYQRLDEELVILVVTVAHRREVYR